MTNVTGPVVTCERCDWPAIPGSRYCESHYSGDLMAPIKDERSPEQHRRWNEFMEHVGTPPEAMGENEAGDFVIDWPRVRFTMHIKPRCE